MRYRLGLLALVVALPLVLWAVLPLGSEGAPSSQQRLDRLQKKMDTTRGKIGRRKGTERVLTRDIEAYNARIGGLERKIGTLRARQGEVQGDLDAARSELARIQSDLRAERRRLVRLRKRLAEARRALAERLVTLYQANEPDLVSVVLQADGFADLLERGEFMQSVSEQDSRIITLVRSARAEAKATEAKLDRLEKRQQRLTARVQQRRDEIAAVKQELIDTKVGYDGTREDKRRALTKVRTERVHLQSQLAEMERSSRRIAAQLRQATAGGGSMPAGPIRQGSGRFVWPVNGTFTSPFGMRWGRLHAGIDIAAPEGTPIRAADSGTVILMQGTGASGGYGNYTCVGHGGGLSTCYAHQVRFGTSMRANVAKGQVIGYVGNTGHSFGAHLHFEVRINGNPVNPMGYL
jgi:murein DD-endopeptidase MepM/ murein hydrolase activator NlpD